MRRTAVLVAALLLPFVVIGAEPKPKSDEIVNNPPFAHWSAFPKGTTVTQREVVKLADGNTIQHDITATLLEKSKEKVVVETAVKVTGRGPEENMADQQTTVTTYPAKVKMSAADTPATALQSISEGKEKVEVKGRKVEAEWVEAIDQRGDEVTIDKVWTARDIPGGIIKRTIVKKRGDKVMSESTLEMVEYKAGS
jgi:hypothetical protein